MPVKHIGITTDSPTTRAIHDAVTFPVEEQMYMSDATKRIVVTIRVQINNKQTNRDQRALALAHEQTNLIVHSILEWRYCTCRVGLPTYRVVALLFL